MCCDGHFYVIDKEFKSNIRWRCSNTKCKGIAVTGNPLSQPMSITTVHTHNPDFTLLEVLLSKLRAKEKAATCDSLPRDIIRDIYIMIYQVKQLQGLRTIN